tara:strand:+ start:185 stop:436 length:252 start_codon:yes stop_codon:yes gene_type:complete
MQSSTTTEHKMTKQEYIELEKILIKIAARWEKSPIWDFYIYPEDCYPHEDRWLVKYQCERNGNWTTETQVITKQEVNEILEEV